MQSRATWAVVSALLFASCRSDRPPTPADAPMSTPSQPAAVDPTTLTYIATDFAFHGPAQVPAGVVTIRLANKGKEFHQLQLVRLAGGKTVADFASAMKDHGPPPEWAAWVGGPTAAQPGSEVNSTQMLSPGQYAVLCLIPSSDLVAHSTKGMVASLHVTSPSSTPAAEPEADIVATLTDYDFKFSSPLTPGLHVIRVENAGPQAHELVLLKLAPGSSLQDFAVWAEKMQGPPPAEGVGGIAILDNDLHSQFSVNLEPGEYGLFCFVPDMKDGKPHLMHGMAKQIKVG